MNRIRVPDALLATIVALSLVAPAAAQQPRAQAPVARPADQVEPYVKSASTNANSLMGDLRMVMELSREGRQQWPELEKYLDVFLIGIDRTRPARVDIIFTEEAERYQPSFPIANLRLFRAENLDTLGITSRQTAGRVFKLGGAYEGFMRFKDNYATFSEDAEAIPPTMPHPIRDVQHLLQGNYDVALDGRNVEQGQEQRRRTFQRIRRDRQAALKKGPDESDDDFAVRRAMLDVQLAEMERVYVEAARMLLGGVVDAAQRDVRFDLELAPLPDTALAASVRQIGERPSRFANVERVRNPILTARINQPLDDTQQQSLLALSQTMRTREQNLNAARRDLTAEQRAAGRQAIDLFFDIADAGVRTGWLDSFAESHTVPQRRNVMVAGIVPEDGTAAIEFLRLLPLARPESQVQLDLDSEGDVQIHSVTVPNEYREDFVYFFGSETLYVGTAEDSLWWAAGENSLEGLKAAIRQAVVPETVAPDQPYVDLFAKLYPWTDLFNRRMGRTGDVELRRMALQGLRPGDDGLRVQLQRVEDEVRGQASGQTGILRFISLFLADFTEELDRQ